ncbi:MAG: flagellar biosynthetic protein FliP [Thermoleophilia bacterium]|nr:flagellar biosynthetic protein FliP [Thermoleophilia bacterium]
MTSVAPTTRASISRRQRTEPTAAQRAKLRKRMRGTIILFLTSLAFLILFPVAAWSADDKQVDSLIQLALYLGGLSLLPFAIMTLTSFLRIVVVLSFLRSGLGAQNVPPNIVIIALALFLSLFVMGPTIDQINKEALQPFQSKDPATQISFEEAVVRAKGPLKEFMVKQISGSSSRKEIRTFYELAREQNPVPCRDSDIDAKTGETKSCLVTPDQFEELGSKAPNALPLRVIIPAFIISELKKAFIMGFAVMLPFLVIDMVISNILLSLGMMMLPPVVISLPFKILLFVLAGGWTMVVKFIVMGFNY